MDFRLRLPGAIYRRARDKAGDDHALADLIRQWLTAYATGETAQARAGRASAAALTADERRQKAQRAATARWADR